jgi:hypothetical protein
MAHWLVHLGEVQNSEASVLATYRAGGKLMHLEGLR